MVLIDYGHMDIIGMRALREVDFAYSIVYMKAPLERANQEVRS